MLNKRTLERINGRPRGTGPAPLVALAALAGAIAAALLVSLALAAIVLAAGVAAGLFLHRRREKERTISLEYDLDPKHTARFARISDACKALSTSKEIRCEDPQSPGHAVEASLFRTPGISANVEIWGLDLPGKKLFFFPECALLYEDDLYRPLPYETFKITVSPYPVTEEGEIPPDADVFGYTWRHVGKDGRPDKRYRDNPRLTQVVYGLLKISGGDFETRLRISNRNAAMRFARVLGSEFSRKTRGNGPHHVSQQERIDREIAYGILGLEPGASSTAITSAYRKLAKVNHPDLMQHLPASEREDAERRMRLLNAAYAELKHRSP